MSRGSTHDSGYCLRAIVSVTPRSSAQLPRNAAETVPASLASWTGPVERGTFGGKRRQFRFCQLQRSTRSQGFSNSTHRVGFQRGLSPKAWGDRNSELGKPPLMPTQPPAAGTVPATLASWEGPVERWAPAESNDEFDFVSCNDQRDRRASATAHTRSGSNGDSPRRPGVTGIQNTASHR